MIVLGAGREGRANTSAALYVRAPYVRRKKGKHCFTKKREREAQTRRQRAAKIRGKREGQTGRVG